MKLSFDVLCIGTATRDVLIKSKDFEVNKLDDGRKKICLFLGDKIGVDEINFSTGGGATNAAVTFTRQGYKTACIALTAKDDGGNAVISELKKEKVLIQLMPREEGITEFSVLMSDEKSGERTILVYHGISEKISVSHFPENKIKPKFIFISSLNGNLELLKKIINFAEKNKILIAYNPGKTELVKKNKLMPLLKKIDILILNREEASFITGIPYQDEASIFKHWDKISPGLNVMTEGPKGVWVSDGQNLYKSGIYKEKKVVDRTGAGDAFSSGFSSGLLRGLSREVSIANITKDDIVFAIRMGSANATSKVEGVGAKYGLLTKSDFQKNPRWKKLDISISKLK